MNEKPWEKLSEKDPEVYHLITKELQRQNEGLELIASENIASQAVVTSMANVFTNKYAEGRPGLRYYGGCIWADELEKLAIDRACNIFF